MREVCRIESREEAELFSDYLLGRGIDNELDQGAGGWQVWVLDDNRLGEADSLYEAFRANPLDPAVTAEAAKADAIRADRLREQRKAAKLEKTREDLFGGSIFYRMGRVTLVLMVLSVIVTLGTRFGKSGDLVRWVLIADPVAVIMSGQVWRFVSPIFLHLGFLHIIFNMMWLMDLGGMMERVRSGRFLLLFVFVAAVVPNVAQYYISGPFFGGMSGVVYGLLGYVWMQAKFNPWSSFVLHQVTVQMMLIWLVLGFTGFLGPVANTVHLAGLLIGVGWGYLDARRALR